MGTERRLLQQKRQREGAPPARNQEGRRTMSWTLGQIEDWMQIQAGDRDDGPVHPERVDAYAREVLTRSGCGVCRSCRLGLVRCDYAR